MGKSLYVTAAFLLHLVRDLIVTVARRWRRFHSRVVLGEEIAAVAMDIAPFDNDTTPESVYAWRLVEAFGRQDSSLVFNLCGHTFPSQDPTHFEELPHNPRLFYRVHRLPDKALLPRRMTISMLRIFLDPLFKILDGADVYFAPDALVLDQREAYARATVATLHDLTFATMPETVEPTTRELLRVRLPAMMHRCDRVIAVSEAAADEVREHLDLPRWRIHTIHQGLDPAFCQVADQARTRDSALPSHYLLFASTLEPRTNVINALRAFRLLADWGYSGALVLLGRWGWRSEKIQHEIQTSPVNDRIQHLQEVNRDELPAIYRGADALLFPSWKEGFGRPLLEAMGCGTPVITSGRSSMPEVAGTAAVYVDPSSPHGIASAVSSIVDDPLHRERLIGLGRERASRFLWDSAAAATIQVLRQAAGLSRQGDDEYRA
ncbi:MAG: glycosyltransferase family 4 protein [bacterium]|nr:glycosyltransferase family 4 protein [bacterium]